MNNKTAINQILDEAIDELEGIAEYTRNELRKAKIILNQSPESQAHYNDVTPEWLVHKMHEHRLKTKDLAQILSVNIASVSRWRKQEIKPMAQALLFYFFNSLNNH